MPFDATGTLRCAIGLDHPTQQCPFGVVRAGPGNAGIWVALPDRAERHILFEDGAPVAADTTDALGFEKIGDLFVVRVRGERYEIPQAVVDGG